MSGYNTTNGYAPRDFQAILQEVVDAVNAEFGTSYTTESFEGSNFYKFFYSGIVQAMAIENATAEIGTKMLDYIRDSNYKISIPKTTPDGTMAVIESEAELVSSIRPVTQETAGRVAICVDVENTLPDYTTIKENLIKIIAQTGDASPYYEGSERGNYVAINGQSFEYAYGLPEKRNLEVRLTVKSSNNTRLKTESTTNVEEKFLENFNSMYRLGFDFEPDRYIDVRDFPFASEIIVEWREGQDEYSSSVLNLAYNEKVVLINVEVTVDGEI